MIGKLLIAGYPVADESEAERISQRLMDVDAALRNEQPPGPDSILHELGDCPAPSPGAQDVREALEKAYRAFNTIEDHSWGSVAGVKRYAREAALEIGAALIAAPPQPGLIEAAEWPRMEGGDTARVRVLRDDELARLKEHLSDFAGKTPAGQFNLGIKKLAQLLYTVEHYRTRAASKGSA